MSNNPEPDGLHVATRADTSERDALRDAMRTIWQDALNVAVHDNSNFFQLGGDSLAALSICSKLEELYAVRPQLRVLFDQPRFEDYMSTYSQILREASR